MSESPEDEDIMEISLGDPMRNNVRCSECDEIATHFWPAYDPDISATPYCTEHLAAAKRIYTPKTPHFFKLGKKQCPAKLP